MSCSEARKMALRRWAKPGASKKQAEVCKRRMTTEEARRMVKLRWAKARKEQEENCPKP